MMPGIDDFAYVEQNYEGELRYVLKFIISCYESIMSDSPMLENHEEKITAHLVEKYLKNSSVQKHYEFSGYIFDREPAAGIHPNYTDTGYLDIKISMLHTFSDPESFFVVECKRIDGSKLLNREYIAEGIMRFITKKYSVALGTNCMLGFCVKSLNCDKNIDKVNQIIRSEFTSSNTTQLLTKYALVKTVQTVYSSEHLHDIQEPSSRIVLYHVMLDYSSIMRP